ncbi:mitochondrial sodium/hydrogen exchanger 9B2-like protein [Dinothrombium tinctorium]|uniref:Mitochondrial sodium/hydrogen exchanger 9B2-like protein n=1 Tax=Dinothrombium tinctorium TaxID=1965070 RepID=A0A3S3RNZ0_9ACAR|nr:mitochondrial sodium/hydrogen exchanger 9B2-like protein [Dinothrombium tinctorium]RWS02590.1 mitochondrial sodium/hydrogen exchanger 9B2-like protein [Dinothrombium tinctorium]
MPKAFDLKELRRYSLLKLPTILIILLIWSCVWSLFDELALPPNGNLFWLIILFIATYFAGEICSLISAPPLVGMLIAGFILRNTTSMKIDAQVSSILRNVALTVILLRAGFGLNPNDLKKLSGVCLRLSFSPCIVETICIAVTTHFLLGLSWQWGFLLGFVLAAVSPAVVVPGMILLNERKLGTDKGVPTLVIAAASVDDVLAITGFGVFLGTVFSSHQSLAWQIAKGPLEAIVGLVAGLFIGVLLWFVPVHLENEKSAPEKKQRLALTLFFGLILVFISQKIGWSGIGPLGALTLSFIAALKWRVKSIDLFVEKQLKSIWFFFQFFLFGLIGAEVNISSIQPDSIGYCLLCLFIGLVFRCFTAMIVTWGAGFSWKEKLFVSLAWLPKATVQAAFGPVALDLARKAGDETKISFATLILNFAALSIVITAPLGALLIALSGPKLLKKEPETIMNEIVVEVDHNGKNLEIISDASHVTKF